jgi:hypothetical protein
VVILVASEEATAGSVIANAERILPSSSGSSHFLRCAGEANMCSSSMLPVSGALQLNTSEAHDTRPMISASGAYSRLVSRVPGSSSRRCGRNKFQRPSARAFSFSSSMKETGYFPALTSSCHWWMRGTICASMNALSCVRSASTFGLYAKSISLFLESW